MKALSAKTKKELENRGSQITLSYEKLQAAIEAYNKEAHTAWEKVKVALQNYNDLLAEARNDMSDLIDTMDGYIAGKSDNWQGSEAGGEYEEWKAAFEDVNLDEVEISEPEDVEVDFDDHAEQLANLPEAPGE